MKKTPKTQEEINAEIQRLKETKKNLRVRVSAFGDNHEDAIDAQIQTLEDGLDEAEVCDRHDNAMDDEPFHADNEYDSALMVIQWRNGGSEEVPSEEWKSLCK